MTTIVENHQPKFVTFEEIEIGDLFKRNNSIYVKTGYSSLVTTNALSLSKNETSLFYEDELVQSVKATITIEP